MSMPVSHEINPESSSAVSQSQALASRLDRLIAAVIDGVILAAVAFPVMLLINMTGLGGSMFLSQILAMAAAAGVFLALNYKMLQASGQTVGKRVMNIRIVGRDDQLLDGNELLLKRYAPVWAAGLVPVIGPLACLGNALCIFRDNRACIHDDIAATKVVNV